MRPVTWLVLFWEIAFGLFLVQNWVREVRGQARFNPDLRLYVLGFGVAMHLGIQAMLYVVWFTPLVLASYLVFLQPQEARAFVGWVQERWARRRASSAS